MRLSQAAPPGGGLTVPRDHEDRGTAAPVSSRCRISVTATAGSSVAEPPGQSTSAPITSAGAIPRKRSATGSPQRQRSLTPSVRGGGSDRSVPSGSGHASPVTDQPRAPGASGSPRNVHSTGAGGAASSHTEPQRSVTVSSRVSLAWSAFGVGSGTQDSSASWADSFASVGGRSVHQVAGLAPSPSVPSSSTALSV